MVRPKRPDRIEKNGGSLKVYLNGLYVGSISIHSLGEYVKARGR